MAQRPSGAVSALRDLSLALERSRAVFVRRNGLVGHDSVILSHLAAAGGSLVPREIAGLMSLRTGTVTAMLDRLEQAGLIARRPNPEDRRSTFIDLTDAGHALLDQYQHHLETALHRAFPPAERAEVTALLARVAQAVESSVASELADETPPPPRASS